MTLCDTGPLIALINQDDLHHTQCVEVLSTLPASPLLTTWPCLVSIRKILGDRCHVLSFVLRS